ncbi:cysteine dioxygenase [Actinokineospora terrae]|uniref:Predicted metal-dependent enzyme of the double-stranded beta helix superfamily n=1 Tax=Actinokineospora terrae TaxID=155974 RepID=A0A1H9QFA5_9PSEU|nr:cysteine dioxygenase family protein [Actinokineospora terrae]SER59108.1 Predicted metal-dependent enzyme of the double-stranded beta helix superfamily [Actinokineospora terrae]
MFAVPPNTVALAATPATAHPALVARRYAEDRASWAPLLRYDPAERFAALVDRVDGQEVWLMSWLPGQQTDLHDHGSVAGAFTVVSGSLTERVAAPHRPAEVLHSLAQGQSRVFGPGYLHQVGNDSADPAVSIHVYRDARPAMRNYRIDPVTGPERLPAR